ncbi:MAG: trypsin-like peptidase domain-containing protein, partial [Gammaproteobacteria bacterium]
MRRLFVAVLLSASFSGLTGVRAAAVLPDFTAIVAKAAPVVVNVSTTRHADSLASNPAPSSDQADASPDWYQRFFGSGGDANSAPNGDASPDSSDPVAESLGSGFIIGADGEILTNYHVIENADSISVKLADRRVLPARVLGVDTGSDLALLKVDAHDLPVADIG